MTPKGAHPNSVKRSGWLFSFFSRVGKYPGETTISGGKGGV